LGYNLSQRYRHGGKCDTGDYRDYYYIGLYVGEGRIVDSNKTTNQDGPAVNTVWQAWDWFGEIVDVEYENGVENFETCDKGKETNKIMAVVKTKGKGALNFRQKPKSNAEFCHNAPSIPEGVKVVVLNINQDWVQVRYGGDTGWVLKKFLLLDK
jgi:SH3-like domain-containing protein